MKIFTAKDIDFVRFTYEEELALARVTMDTLSTLWIEGPFLQFLNKLYFRKARSGKDITTETLEELCIYFERFELEIPEFELNDKSISGHGYEEVQQDVVHAWYDVWSTHTKFQNAADDYQEFPGEKFFAAKRRERPGYAKDQEAMENAFWEEVDRISGELNVPQTQAIISVEDYMARPDARFQRRG